MNQKSRIVAYPGYAQKRYRYHPSYTRGISSIDASTNANTSLWTAAEAMLAQKAA